MRGCARPAAAPLGPSEKNHCREATESQTERLYRINQLLSLGLCLGPERLLVELGVSAATVLNCRCRVPSPVPCGATLHDR